MSPKARVALIAGLLVFAAIAARLGAWQVDRLHQRRAANAAALAMRQAPEVDLNAQRAGVLANRRVHATGRYDRANELVLRGRALGEVPGVALVTPLRLAGAGDTAVLVERGFVPTPDAVTLPPEAAALDEPGVQRVEGVALPIGTAATRGAPLVHEGRTTWHRLDLAALRTRLSYPILDVYILQTPDSALPTLPRRRPAPDLDDEGPHLSYAIQWFAFAVTAVVFAALFWRRGA